MPRASTRSLIVTVLGLAVALGGVARAQDGSGATLGEIHSKKPVAPPAPGGYPEELVLRPIVLPPLMGEGTLALHASHLESQVLWALEPGVAFAPLRGLELAVAADLGLGTFSTLTFDHLGFAAHYAVVAGDPVSFAPGLSVRLCFDSFTCPDLPSELHIDATMHVLLGRRVLLVAGDDLIHRMEHTPVTGLTWFVNLALNAHVYFQVAPPFAVGVGTQLFSIALGGTGNTSRVLFKDYLPLDLRASYAVTRWLDLAVDFDAADLEHASDFWDLRLLAAARF